MDRIADSSSSEPPSGVGAGTSTTDMPLAEDEDSIAEAKISVLMTCYNRRDKTLRCLESLFSQKCKAQLTVYLVDDASTDGTAEAVTWRFPQVELIAGTGALYWAGGTRKAYEVASKASFDFALWLNDDVELEADAIDRLLGTHASVAQASAEPAIVVGALKDPHLAVTTYSGAMRTSRLRRMNFSRVEPADRPKRCETMNGNLVLIPRMVCEVVGTVDEVYVHTMGDLDFGLRATKAGCAVWIAGGHLGVCSRNGTVGTYADVSLPVIQRLRALGTVKNMYGPSNLQFVRRHGGPFWPVYWLSPYVSVIVTSVLRRIKAFSGISKRRP